MLIKPDWNKLKEEKKRKALFDFYNHPLQTWIPNEQWNPKQLLPYQNEVLTKLETFLFSNNKVLLHLDTGLGKTFITLNLIAYNKNDYLDKNIPILIIAPASNLIDPWCKEIEEMNKTQEKKYKYYVYHGIDKDILSVNGYLHLEGFDFVLISYQTLESDNCNKYFFSTQFNFIIYDEPQTIINPNTETGTLKKLEKVSGKKRLALTASPLSNSITELYILSTLLNNPENIKEAYIELKTLKNKDELVRRAKYNTQIISVSKFEKDIFEQMDMRPLREYIIELPVPDIVKEKMKELSSGAQRTLLLAKPEDYISDIPTDDLSFDSKTKTAELILSLIPKPQKTIIFSMHTECLDKLHGRLSRSYDCFKVIGGMTQKEKNRVVNNFKVFNGQAIMLASLKANTTGLNYQEANNVIFMDSWYNPEAMKQARDRCFRMGQRNTTTVFYLTTNTFHEKNIYRIKDEKSRIAKKVLNMELNEPPHEIILSLDNESYLEALESFLKEEVYPPEKKPSFEIDTPKPFKLKRLNINIPSYNSNDDDEF